MSLAEYLPREHVSIEKQTGIVEAIQYVATNISRKEMWASIAIVVAGKIPDVDSHFNSDCYAVGQICYETRKPELKIEKETTKKIFGYFESVTSEVRTYSTLYDLVDFLIPFSPLLRTTLPQIKIKTGEMQKSIERTKAMIEIRSP